MCSGAGAGQCVALLTVCAISERGLSVAINQKLSTERPKAHEREILDRGGQAVRFQADLSDAAAARELPAQVAHRFGRLDVLVNSAGIMRRATVEETTPELWDEVMNVNLRAYFFCAQGALPALRATEGRIINIADLGGLEPWPGYIAHSISKSGVVMLTRTLALALAPGITVNGIAPGAVLPPDDWPEEARDHLIRTTPLARLGSPTDVAGAMLFLLEGGDYLTGQTIVVDGGRMIR